MSMRTTNVRILKIYYCLIGGWLIRVDLEALVDVDPHRAYWALARCVIANAPRYLNQSTMSIEVFDITLGTFPCGLWSTLCLELFARHDIVKCMSISYPGCVHDPYLFCTIWSAWVDCPKFRVGGD